MYTLNGSFHTVISFVENEHNGDNQINELNQSQNRKTDFVCLPAFLVPGFYTVINNHDYID